MSSCSFSPNQMLTYVTLFSPKKINKVTKNTILRVVEKDNLDLIDSRYFFETPKQAVKTLCFKCSPPIYYERINVATHIFATLCVIATLSTVVSIHPNGNTLYVLSRIGAASSITTFAISATFHTFRGVLKPTRLGDILFFLDQLGILVSIATNCYAHVAVWGENVAPEALLQDHHRGERQ